jgi:hypothetical protein
MHLALLAVTGNKGDSMGMVAMSQWYLSCCSATD